jgi:hypothetical protein
MPASEAPEGGSGACVSLSRRETPYAHTNRTTVARTMNCAAFLIILSLCQRSISLWFMGGLLGSFTPAEKRSRKPSLLQGFGYS